MGAENTIMMSDGDTIKILSASQAPTILSSSNPSSTIQVTEEHIKFSVDELASLPSLETQYTVSDKIAEGGQGVIHKAKDKFLKREVVVKSLKSEFLDEPKVIETFVTEAKITSQLDHPAIIPLHTLNSSGDEKGLHIAMKMIRGRNLREIFDDTVLKCKECRRSGNFRELTSVFLKERLEDFVKVCDAVAFAHNKGVFHRDIKPSNIMIGEFHEVYVMDWGIACLKGGYVVKKAGAGDDGKPKISGTPGFIAPEVVVGGAHSAKSDQYALGIILFEIATMSPAIVGNDVREVFEKTRDDRLEPLAHRFPRCPISTELKAIIRKATATNPERRYENVAGLAADLRRFLAGDETEALPDNPPRRVARWLAKHRNLAATIMLSFLLCCAGIAIFALVKRNQAIRETKRRSLLLASLQSSVESRAHVIDKYYLHIVHFLDRLVWDAKERLTENKASASPLFIDYKQFKANSPFAPPFLSRAESYGGVPISFSFGSVKAAPGGNVTPDDVKRYSKILSSLVPLMFRLLVYSDPEHFPKNTAQARKYALSTGYPIAWIYLGLTNGLIFNFPGHSGFPASYDPRRRTWYESAVDSGKMVWSAPYVDAFGRGLVVSVSKAVRDDGGKLFGVVGIDTTFNYITKVLMNADDKAHSWGRGRYLLDAEGKVLISSEPKDSEDASDESVLEFPPFPYIEIYSHLSREDSGRFEVVENGKTLLVVYAPVETLGWHFVEVVDSFQFFNPRR